MKILSTTLLLLTFAFTSFAQTTAITTGGDTVLLHEDGTWVFKNKVSSKNNLEEIPFNDKRFVKPSSATKYLTGGKGAYEIWYDPSVWNKTSPNKYNRDAELALEMKSQLAYGIMIYEKLEIPVEMLLEIAYENAKSSAPNFKIVNKEYRIVNGIKVALMQMEGEIEGINATYYSYYYSNNAGTWQFHTFTMTSMFKQFKKEMEALLNGLVIK